MGREAAIWAGASLLAVLVIGVAVVLIRARSRRRAADLSRDEKLRRARRAADQISRKRKRTAKGSLRGKGGGGGSEWSAQDIARAHDAGPSGGWDSGGSDGGGSGGGGGGGSD